MPSTIRIWRWTQNIHCMTELGHVLSNAVVLKVKKPGSSMWIIAYVSQHQHLPVPAVPRSRKLQDSPGMVPAARQMAVAIRKENRGL